MTTELLCLCVMCTCVCMCVVQACVYRSACRGVGWCSWECQRKTLVIHFHHSSPFPLEAGFLTELGACHFSDEAGSQRVPAALLSLYPHTQHCTCKHVCDHTKLFYVSSRNPNSSPHTWVAGCLTHGVIFPASTECFLQEAIIVQDSCSLVVAVWQYP